MLDFFRNLLDTSDFPARWRCGDWSSFHGYLHIVSDLLVWSAYTAIPCVLIFYILRRRDLAFPKLFWLFCIFIFACGTSHLLEAVIFYYPIYRISALVKLLTGVVSWAAVIALIRIAPEALRLPSLKRLNANLLQQIQTRKEVEAELRRQEQRYRSLTELVASVIWQIDDQGHMHPPQEDWTAYTGQSQEAWRQRGWLEAIHESDRQAVATELDRALAQQRDFRSEARLWHQPSQSYRHVQLRATPLLDNDRLSDGYIGLLDDDHERWLADQRFRLALEAAPSAMILVDNGGNIILSNQNAQELFGYSREQLANLSVDQLVPRQLRKLLLDNRQGYTEQPTARNMGHGRELYCRRQDGSEVPVEIGLTPLDTPEGPMIVCSIVDITERKLASEQLEERAQALARSNRDLDRFASIVSHDLREPLRMINSFSQLLNRHHADDLGERAGKWLRFIHEGAERMDHLIIDLLSFSRVNSQGMTCKTVPLHHVVRQATDNLNQMIEETQAQIDTGELPEIQADPSLLAQVFQNLIANAIRFRRQGETPRINIDVITTDTHWQVKVRDNGIGMEERDYERIFEIFSRLHTRDDYPGTGIGLAICKRVVDLHGGRIWVDSVLGEGTTFTFTLAR